MAKKVLIFVIVALVGGLVLAVLNFLFFGGDVKQAVAPTEGDGGGISSATPAPGSDVQETVVVSNNVVTYLDSGFSPSTLTIKAGERVTFRNESSRAFWPASAVHPTHKVYPGSDIQKCGTAEERQIFDACRGIEPGSEWSFKFDNVGTWKYHDHLNASKTGTIVVE